MPANTQLTSPRYEHMLVMINPEAYDTSQARLETDSLHERGVIHVDYVKTHPSWQVTQKTLLREATPGSMVGIIGGDGTYRNVAKGWMEGGVDAFPDVPLSFFDGGNIRDGRRALNGDSSIEDIVIRGINSRIQLIQADLLFPNGERETDYAVSYESIGGVAASCKSHAPLKEQAKESRIAGLTPVRRAREFASTAKAAGQYSGFVVVESNAQGEERLIPLQDVTGIHSSVIAGAGKTHTDHWQPNMEVVTSVKRGVGRAAVSLVTMGLGIKYGVMSPEYTIKVRARKDKKGCMAESVPMQLDGDVRELPNDTVITLKLSDKRLLIRSTRASRLEAA